MDRVDALDARLALSGHGKPFVDVHGHIEGNRRLVHERLEATVAALGCRAPDGGRDRAGDLRRAAARHNAGWLLAQTLCYLRHLERRGTLRSESAGAAERWTTAG